MIVHTSTKLDGEIIIETRAFLLANEKMFAEHALSIVTKAGERTKQVNSIVILQAS